MTGRTDLGNLLLHALRQVPGLRPAQPATVPARVSWDADLMAVDIDDDQVTVRVVASQLPLPPLLTQAGAVLRAALDEHGHGGLRLRLEVTDLDRAAFSPRSRPPSSRRGVTPGHQQGLSP
jgi:hypothetical protein